MLFSLAEAELKLQPYGGTKTRRRSNMWGVVEAMLSQVGKLSEAVKKERERRLQKGVRVFIRASEMACLTASISPGVSI